MTELTATFPADPAWRPAAGALLAAANRRKDADVRDESTMSRSILISLTALLGLACTPPEPPPPRPATPKKGAVTTPAEVPPDPQAALAARTDGLTGGKLVFEDHFDRADPAPDWLVKQTGEWTIDDGWLHAHTLPDENQRNQGVWMQKPLPDKVRIVFQAKAMSAVGDTKCEVFAEAQRHESGYSIIFGGWNNTINTITRRGEHEPHRVLQSNPQKVETGRVYTWTIVKTDSVVRWYVDGRFMIGYADADPVRGRFFGFNNWATDVRFDNVQVYEL